MTNTAAYIISFLNEGSLQQARIQPCCRQDNIVDYAVYVDEKLLLTIARDDTRPGHWLVAMKNADDEISDETVQNIGREIDNRKNS
jgi:diadenosine tetraphosphate (Ap4A) HIT family hydrolase